MKFHCECHVGGLTTFHRMSDRGCHHGRVPIASECTTETCEDSLSHRTWAGIETDKAGEGGGRTPHYGSV